MVLYFLCLCFHNQITEHTNHQKMYLLIYVFLDDCSFIQIFSHHHFILASLDILHYNNYCVIASLTCVFLSHYITCQHFPAASLTCILSSLPQLQHHQVMATGWQQQSPPWARPSYGGCCWGWCAHSHHDQPHLGRQNQVSCHFFSNDTSIFLISLHTLWPFLYQDTSKFKIGHSLVLSWSGE